MFQPASIHCTESVEIIDGDGMARAAVGMSYKLTYLYLLSFLLHMMTFEILLFLDVTSSI